MTIQERADNDADPTAITPSKSDPQANLTDVPIPPSPISSPLRPIARAIAEPISMLRTDRSIVVFTETSTNTSKHPDRNACNLATNRMAACRK